WSLGGAARTERDRPTLRARRHPARGGRQPDDVRVDSRGPEHRHVLHRSLVRRAPGCAGAAVVTGGVAASAGEAAGPRRLPRRARSSSYERANVLTWRSIIPAPAPGSGMSSPSAALPTETFPL